MVKPHPPDRSLHPETLLVTSGRNPADQKGFVNPPVVHGSTVLYPTARNVRADRGEYTYGRSGTPTSRALEQALTVLEGPSCAGVVLTPSGVSAITTALLAALKAGDHLLMIDNVYRPTRRFCDSVLKRYGVETTYFDPLAGKDIAALFRPNTAAVFVEAPGSQSMEMPDIPAIAEVAHARGALVINDNTWATPLCFPSLDRGVDIATQSVTKYIGGHSDVMFGAVAANEKAWRQLAQTHKALGICTGPDDIYLVLRGLRTLSVRLKHQEKAGYDIARWFAARPEVSRVLHPGLESDPGHAIWKRDFKGASGLFSIILKPAPQSAADAFLDALKLFGMGFSWGGFESLVIPFDCRDYRTATTWAPEGPALRFSIGLENIDDLRADLDQAFAAFNAAK